MREKEDMFALVFQQDPPLDNLFSRPWNRQPCARILPQSRAPLPTKNFNPKPLSP